MPRIRPWSSPQPYPTRNLVPTTITQRKMRKQTKKSSTMVYATTGDSAFCTLRRMFSLFFRMGVVYYIQTRTRMRAPLNHDARLTRASPFSACFRTLDDASSFGRTPNRWQTRHLGRKGAFSDRKEATSWRRMSSSAEKSASKAKSPAAARANRLPSPDDYFRVQETGAVRRAAAGRCVTRSAFRRTSSYFSRSSQLTSRSIGGSTLQS